MAVCAAYPPSVQSRSQLRCRHPQNAAGSCRPPPEGFTDGYPRPYPILRRIPQVAPEDFATIRAAGFVTVINNRPDAEIPPHLHTDPMRQAAEAAGLTYVVNPVIGGAITEDNVATQRQTIEQSPGPVFAYCASGNRSSVVWALAHAGKVPADELIGTAARFGYSLEWLRPTLEQQD